MVLINDENYVTLNTLIQIGNFIFFSLIIIYHYQYFFYKTVVRFKRKKLKQSTLAIQTLIIDFAF